MFDEEARRRIELEDCALESFAAKWAIESRVNVMPPRAVLADLLHRSRRGAAAMLQAAKDDPDYYESDDPDEYHGDDL